MVRVHSDDNKQVDQESAGPKTRGVTEKMLRACRPSCGKRARRCWSCVGCCIGVLVAVVLLLVHFLTPRDPSWEVTGMFIENFSVPLLEAAGFAAPDFSGCPGDDPCGQANAPGCSRCPGPEDQNMGCICQQALADDVGIVVGANTSACPWYDKCGVGAARGCSSCPGPSWTNDGCVCHSEENIRAGVQALQQDDVAYVTMRVDVRLQNKNYLGSDVAPTEVNVAYKGTTIGSAHIEAFHIGARTSAVMTMHVTVDRVSMGTGMMMAQEILARGMKVKVEASGTSAVVVWGWDVQTQVTCNVTANLLNLFELEEKECTYVHDIL